MVIGRQTLTIEETRKLLGISRNSAYNAARRGELPGVIRIGKRFVVSKVALERLLGISIKGQGAA